MFGRTMRRAAVMLAIVAVPAAIFAAPSPAFASGSRLCETSGSHCLGAASLQVNQTVVETSLSSARYLIAAKQSGTFQGHTQYKLKFSGNTGVCVTGGLVVEVVIHNCGDWGTLWAQDGSRWINVDVTKYFNTGYDVYLAGLNNGSAYQLKYLGQGGFLYQFTWK
jgi:hypothetical protein